MRMLIKAFAAFVALALVVPAHAQTLKVGLRFVWRESVLLSALTLDLFSVLLGGAEALLPIFAGSILHVGPEGLGILRGAPAVGAVLISIYLAHRPPFERAGRTLPARNTRRETR